jgi:hypothetical protein
MAKAVGQMGCKKNESAHQQYNQNKSAQSHSVSDLSNLPVTDTAWPVSGSFSGIQRGQGDIAASSFPATIL